MNRNKWTDVTSYRHGERGAIEPRSWEMRVGELMMCVTRYVGHVGWVCHCHALNIDIEPLEAVDIANAQVEALRLVQVKLSRLMLAIEEVIPKSGGAT